MTFYNGWAAVAIIAMYVVMTLLPESLCILGTSSQQGLAGTVAFYLAWSITV
jgi:hypothetical protein